MKLIIKILSLVCLTFGFALASPHSLDDAHTSVGFKVKHLMITNVFGEFKDFKADIDFDYATKKFNKFKGVVQTASVDTENVKRDNHLRSEDFFLSDKYPEMTYEMLSYEVDGDDEGVMKGNLTIRGVTKPVTLEVEDLGVIKDFEGNNRVGFTLKGKINRMDYGLSWNKAIEFGGVAVSETVKIIIEAQAVEQ